MAKINLTPSNVTVNINTFNESMCLTSSLFHKEFSEVNIDNVRISICTDANGKPEFVYTNDNGYANVHVLLTYVNDNDELVKEDIWLDAFDICSQLNDAKFDYSNYGKFAYRTWTNKITFSTNLVENGNNTISFNETDVPFLKSENVEVCGYVYPRISNLGWDENFNFHARIEVREINAELVIDANDLLNSYATIIQ